MGAAVHNPQFRPFLIGIGLIILITAAYSPSAPVITAMAFVALGSTEVVISRLRGSAAALPILVLHGFTYALLYSLFVGARIEVPATAPPVSNMTMFDLAVSAVPMTVTLGRIFNCLRPRTMSRQ